ncbi:MAG: glyoxylate/hydroxypyruvate reductase A [marine bacterium B5-7]|nr:MAG: glyoxylate/hydroxypyruvate reductase A [marine bacterium B5-7]
MAILIDIRQVDWITDESLKSLLESYLPNADIRCAAKPGDPADITMLAVSSTEPGEFAQYPNLKLVQKLGAGVETIVGDPSLPPHVRVTRLKSDAPAREISEYCLAHVLGELRHLKRYGDAQAHCRWDPVPPRSSLGTVIGVLGLGHIGGRVAEVFASLGFTVHGYSRHPKQIEKVTCHHGDDALDTVLALADFVVSILPSTPHTRGLFDAQRFTMMKPGAVLINVGRGELIVEQDLLNALDSGRLGGAVLDVFHHEPLPPDDPLWRHPRVVITPHVSGWHIDDGLADIAENFKRLQSGEPLLYQVDRNAGY